VNLFLNMVFVLLFNTLIVRLLKVVLCTLARRRYTKCSETCENEKNVLKFLKHCTIFKIHFNLKALYYGNKFTCNLLNWLIKP